MAPARAPPAYLTSFVTGTGRRRRVLIYLDWLSCSGAGEWWRAQSRFTAICYATPPASSTRETSLRARAAIASSAQGPDQRYYAYGAGSPGARGARTLGYVRLLLLSAAMLMGQSSPANVMATIFGTKQDRCAHGTGALRPSGRSCPVYRDCQRKEACGPELSSTSSPDRTLRNERPELRELGTKDGGWRTRSEDAAKDPAHMNAFELTLPQGCPRDDGVFFVVCRELYCGIDRCRWWAIEVGGLVAGLGYQMSSDDDQ
ncbi:predicted protein [Postia placenta Mad-698-R]|nr:predicted protein [Postia placenta Mad-698-R]